MTSEKLRNLSKTFKAWSGISAGVVLSPDQALGVSLALQLAAEDVAGMEGAPVPPWLAGDDLGANVVRFADFAPAPRPAPVAPRGAA
jgi:hypothetical protein